MFDPENFPTPGNPDEMIHPPRLETYAFDMQKIMACPPIFTALDILGVPNTVITQASGYSGAMVCQWRQGNNDFKRHQATRLIDFAIGIIRTLLDSGDFIAALDRPIRDKIELRISAARALVGLQRYVSLGYDLDRADTAQWKAVIQEIDAAAAALASKPSPDSIADKHAAHLAALEAARIKRQLEAAQRPKRRGYQRKIKADYLRPKKPQANP